VLYVISERGGVGQVRRDLLASERFPTIFISYRRSDSEIIGRIYDRLTTAFGGNAVFKDVESLPPGANVRKYVEGAVGRCTVVLAVIGPDWLGLRDDGTSRIQDPDDFVRLELFYSLKYKKPIIPILVRGAQMPTKNQLPRPISNFSSLNALKVRADPDFNNDIERLQKVTTRTIVLHHKSGELALSWPPSD
jgi:hypothetical protein